MRQKRKFKPNNCDFIRNLEPNCEYSCSSEIVACKDFFGGLWPLKTFACVSLRYRNCYGGMAIVVVVCGNICGKIEKLLDQNKIWCGTKYGPRDYDSCDKKKEGKNTKRQNDKTTK